MENLPVKKLNYGGAFSSSSLIQFNLGPLVCTRKSKPYATEYLDIMKKQIEMIINANDIQKAFIEKMGIEHRNQLFYLLPGLHHQNVTDGTTWGPPGLTLVAQLVSPPGLIPPLTVKGDSVNLFYS